MRNVHHRPPRNQTANWPDGWSAEVDRLAQLYVQTVAGIGEVEQDASRWDRDAQQFRKAAEALGAAADQLKPLINNDHGIQVVRAAGVNPQVGIRIGPASLNGYYDRLAALSEMNASVALDLEAAARSLDARMTPDKGNQSTLALRFTISAAASSYTKLFKKPPGLSRSDYGPFGRFVNEILARVPDKERPLLPAASAINDVLQQWQLRQLRRP